MCVIVYKPKNVDFPSKETLEKCWNKNDDGAGFMYPYKNKVVIKKGFMTFDEFYEELTSTINTYGDKRPFVMHFRITTQGGVQAKLTHPYPISKNMDDLRELRFVSDMGVAHNGIISLTSNHSENDNNDTMKFITDYLSLIVKNRSYYKDADNLDLISKLCKSKLAILDGAGHVELIGNFIKGEDDCYYSNENFRTYNDTKTINYNYYRYYDIPKSENKTDAIICENADKTVWKNFKRGSKYYFIKNVFCPKSEYKDCSYCGACAYCDECGKKCNRKKGE
jgi:predicted glutamine amidotransferase